MATVDPHSFADPDQGRVHRLALDLNVDFDAKRLSGTATLGLDGAKGGVLDLDTRDLDISGVRLGDGTELRFELGDADAVLGQRLRISVPDATDEITIEYLGDEVITDALDLVRRDMFAPGENGTDRIRADNQAVRVGFLDLPRDAGDRAPGARTHHYQIGRAHV